MESAYTNFIANTNFTCEICDKSLSTKKIKKQHIKNNHRVVKNVNSQRNYKCDSCGKSFTQSGNLKIHTKTVHEGQRNYKCDSCGKSFTVSGSLKKLPQESHL